MALDSAPLELADDDEVQSETSARRRRRRAMIAALILAAVFGVFTASGAEATVQHSLAHLLPGLADPCGGG